MWQQPFLRSSAASANLTSANREAPAASGWNWNRLVSRSVAAPSPFDTLDGRFVRSRRMARVEAVLLVSNSAVSPRRLAQLATLADGREAIALIDKLNHAYDCGNTAFRIERVAAGFRMLTRPELVFWLDRLHQREARCKLSQPMLETLTIVAYQQPITRADVEAIRGVASSELLKQLMERGLVRIAGHDDSLGRPYLYGTTRLFLEMYGMKSLDDLPMADELRRRNPSPAASGETTSAGNESSDTDANDAEAASDTEGETHIDTAA